jgi:hypothetical protein
MSAGRILPAPQFHDDRARRDAFGYAVRILLQHLNLGVGQVVFFLVRDLFE